MTAKGSHTRVLRRSGALLLAVVQLFVFGLVPTADSLLDSDSVQVGLHVESEGSEHCSAAHDHLFCQVFRSFWAVGGSEFPARALVMPPVQATSTSPGIEAAPVRPVWAFGSLGSRAPPIA